MNTDKFQEVTDEKTRRPGQRPDARERDELLSWVERALMGGARRPADVLDAVPDLGTWDTARSYMDDVLGQWRREAAGEDLRAQRAEMVAIARATMKRAYVALGRTEKPWEIDRLGRLIDKMIDRLTFLLALNPEAMAYEDRTRAEEEKRRAWEEETREERELLEELYAPEFAEMDARKHETWDSFSPETQARLKASSERRLAILDRMEAERSVGAQHAAPVSVQPTQNLGAACCAPTKDPADTPDSPSSTRIDDDEERAFRVSQEVFRDLVARHS